MDLSKKFDTLDHSLLLTKLSAYGFDNNSLSFVRSYLTNRIQRCKIENHFSNWREITTGVPQRSNLRRLLFNIFINDIFLFVESSSISNYADDNTLFAFGKTSDEVTRNRAACTNNQCLHKISFQLLPIGLDVLLQGDYA